MALPTLHTLLRGKNEIFRQAKEMPFSSLLLFILISALGMAIFGAVKGITSNRWEEYVHPAWKVVTAYWGTMLICLPSLFIFSLIRGSRITARELIVFLVGSMATIGIVLVSLAPITGFFTWTSTVREDARIIHYAAGALGLIFGLRFFGEGLMAVHKKAKEQSLPSSAAPDVVLIWFFLFLLVMVQMLEKLDI